MKGLKENLKLSDNDSLFVHTKVYGRFMHEAKHSSQCCI